MKRFVIMMSLLAIMGAGAIPSAFALEKSSISVSIKEDSGKYRKMAKVSKKRKKEKKKDTKRRVKKLNEIGINPKSYLSYGEDLSLQEFGKIIGAWIVDVWVRTNQLPSVLTDNPPDWLMVNINGDCYSASKTCDRWEE